MNDLDDDTCRRALTARDARFDGRFFVGVTSTGIYCRPICPAQPKPKNCRFFPNASLAQQAGFRPCKRCRPEQAPGLTSIDFGSTIVAAAVDQIEQNGSMIVCVSNILRHLGSHVASSATTVQEHVGVSPVQWMQTSRLLMAKRLLTETNLRMTEVAGVSGFQSVRRMNALFREQFQMSPTDFRASVGNVHTSRHRRLSMTLSLGYRPPYAWDEIMRYIRARIIPGVESMDASVYRRTVEIGEHSGWLSVSHDAARDQLILEIASSLLPVVPAIITRVRKAFDLNASPQSIQAVLSSDRLLRPSLRRAPGLRLPAAVGRYETRCERLSVNRFPLSRQQR
ncbi:MAG: AlkA N-terminal domain-containing protein [Pirellulaceae bacterium]